MLNLSQQSPVNLSQRHRRDSELSGKGSIRNFTPPFTEEDRKLMVQRLPHGETVNKSSFRVRNILLALFRTRNTLDGVSEHNAS